MGSWTALCTCPEPAFVHRAPCSPSLLGPLPQHHEARADCGVGDGTGARLCELRDSEMPLGIWEP